MRPSTSRRLLVLLLLSLAAGCASVDAPSHRAEHCAGWYAALDREVDAAGVRDAQYARVRGFPYLRVDRVLASLRERAALTAPALQAYAERLSELDLEARSHEIRNLPRGRIEALLGHQASPKDALRRTRHCALILRERDLAEPAARAALLEQAGVPDDYSLGARFLGLYPLTRLGFANGIWRWEEAARARFQARTEDARAVRYAPPPAPFLPRNAVAGLLARGRFDALGQPLLSEREFGALAAAYAPSFEVLVVGDYDRFGELRWRRGAEVPQVDASVLAVYVHPAYTRYGERVLLQLVYTIWFQERPWRGAVDFLAGQLDGVTWRVTLAPDGEPLIYDSIHPCGCYHQFFPTPRARARKAPNALEEWVFVPQALPRIADGQRPLVKLASGTHYIDGVAVVHGTDSLTRYEFRPYGELRSMPRLDGASRSAFGPDGLIAGTERLERFFLWPSGVRSAGAMRQWGRHATAFVGRRHFDDADLIERRFELDLGEDGR